MELEGVDEEYYSKMPGGVRFNRALDKIVNRKIILCTFTGELENKIVHFLLKKY